MNTQPELLRRDRLHLSIIFIVIIHLGLVMPAYSQRFTFGATIAGQITNTFAYPGPPPGLHEDRELFGPMAEMRLAHNMSLELDALYKRKLDYSETFGSYQPYSPRGTTDVTTHSWDLPLILV